MNMNLQVLLLFAFLAACTTNTSEDFAAEYKNEATLTTAEEEQGLNQKNVADKDSDVTEDFNLKVIRTADVSMEVRDLNASIDHIENLVAQHEAYIATSNFNNSSYRLESNLTIRVLSKNFMALMRELDKEAIHVNYRNISAKDVSEEYLDLEIRLKTKKEVRARYEEILRKQAGTIQELLQAEEAIRVLQEEIEAKEGRLRYLQNQVKFSTIQLKLYQEVAYVAETPTRPTYLSELKAAFLSGGQGIATFFLVLVTIWPFTLLAIAFLIWKRKWVFKKRTFAK